MFTDSGEVRFSIKAPKLLRYEGEGKPYVEFPQGIELVKYDANQKIISSITANYAKQFEKEDRWEAKNNVIATNAPVSYTHLDVYKRQPRRYKCPL